MISVNISTIKQYFWYYDNFNKTHKIGDKRILPILKIKEKYYIFHNVLNAFFDEFLLTSKHFIPYDKQYSYKVINDTITTSTIIEEFSDNICVFIRVDDNLKWTIDKTEQLKGNIFYEQSIADANLIHFNFSIKKKPSKESVCQIQQPQTMCNYTTHIPISDVKISNDDRIIAEIEEKCTREEYPQYSPPIEDPFWDDAVFIEN